METFYGPEGEVTLPAGDYVAIAMAGQATAETPFTVKPAERTEVTVVAAVGAVAVSAPGAASIDILSAKADLNGDRARLHTDYSDAAEAMLSPGDYVAVATRDLATAEAAFTITDGQRTEVTVTLVMGQAAVTAEGALSIEIVEAKADLNGDRKRLHTDYSGAATVMLPPGDYVALAYFGDAAPVEAPFAITDGAVAQVTVPKP